MSLFAPKEQPVDNQEFAQYTISDAEQARRAAKNLKTQQSMDRYKQILANTYVKGLGMNYPLAFGQQGAFNQTYDTLTNETVKLINLMHTIAKERVMQPGFGLELEQFLFENITPQLTTQIETQVRNKITTWIPNVSINDLAVQVVSNEDSDRNRIYITINFGLKTSQTTQDTITFQF